LQLQFKDSVKCNKIGAWDKSLESKNSSTKKVSTEQLMSQHPSPQRHPVDAATSTASGTQPTQTAPRHLLFALDFSGCSLYALECGLRQLHPQHQDTITLLAIVSPPPADMRHSLRVEFDAQEEERRHLDQLQVREPVFRGVLPDILRAHQSGNIHWPRRNCGRPWTGN
jgi:hypothetical protein